MKALVKWEAAPGLRLDDVPRPVPKRGEVLIKVLRTGICGTDLHIYKWDEWAQATVATPRVLGHEFVGVVAANASDRPLEEGALVGGESHLVCASCASCMAGRHHLCGGTRVIGIHRDGAFAEYVTLPAENVWRYADGTDLDVAAIFDPFGNAVHAALHFDLSGEDVLITGAGPIGLMAAAVAAHAGARSVVVSDVNDHRVELARRLGLRAVRDLRTLAAEERAFTVGLEMSGHPAALREMVHAMVPGGRIAALGLMSAPIDVDWSQMVTKMLTVQGIFGRRIFDTWHAMSRLLSEGLEIAPLVTDRFAHDDYEAAFELVASGRCGKVVLDWGAAPGAPASAAVAEPRVAATYV
jgi:threonine 3-dehydrogenase